MKICTRCGNVLPDEEDFCSRCGGRNFKAQAQQTNQGQQMQRPQGQGQTMQRPQQQMQRPQGQGQPMQRPQQQQGMRPQGQSQPMQRPQQQMQRPQGQGQPMQRPQQQQMQQMQRPQQQMQPTQNQNMMNGFDGQQFDNNDMFPDTPVETKKGLFKKGNKQPKQPKQQPQMQQQMGNNGFEPTMEPIVEDGSSVGDWIKTLLVFIIPIYGLIKYFTGMKDMSQPAYKRNFYKAFLIYFVACIAVSFILSLVLGALMGAALGALM